MRSGEENRKDFIMLSHIRRFLNKNLPGYSMTSSRNMVDFGPYWAILRDLNDNILQMTPFSLSTFHDLPDGTIKIPAWELFENLVYRDLYCTEKWRHQKMAKKGFKTFPIDCAFFLVALGLLRDLCAKFQPHTIFFKVKAFFELILPDYLLMWFIQEVMYFEQL